MLSLLVIGMPMGLAAQEFIIHANGDSINGDIEGFRRGKVKFKIRGGSSSTIKYEELVTFGSPDTWDNRAYREPARTGLLPAEHGSRPTCVW